MRSNPISSDIAESCLVRCFVAFASMLVTLSHVHAEDLSDPEAPLSSEAEKRSSDLKLSVSEWTLGVRDLRGRVKSFRTALSDLVTSIKGWTLIEEDMYYLVRMDSDILFDFDSADLRPEARGPLEQFAEVLVPYEIKSLTITGHTDSKGTDDYNDKLSLKRARSVEAFLRQTKRLSGWSFTTIGRGEHEPIAANEHPDGRDDPTGRQRNRRVELRIKKASK